MEEWQEELEVTQDGMQGGRKARGREPEEEGRKTTRPPLFPSLIRRGLGGSRPAQRQPWRTAWTLGPCKCSVVAKAPPGSQCGRRDMWWAVPGWDSASPPPLEWLQVRGGGARGPVSIQVSDGGSPGGGDRLTTHRETGRRRHQRHSGTALAPAPISACGTDWHRGSSRRWWGSRTWWRWSAHQIPGWSLPAGGERQRAAARFHLIAIKGIFQIK